MYLVWQVRNYLLLEEKESFHSLPRHASRWTANSKSSHGKQQDVKPYNLSNFELIRKERLS